MLTPQAREFFTRVIPWPTEDRPGIYTGYINLHWTFLKDGGKKTKPLWAGRAFQTPSKFFDFIDWSSTRSNFRDTYFCLSRQSSALVDPKRGTLKAVRLAQNAIDLKAIWLDIDVKTPGIDKSKPEYDTLEIALQALQVFVGARGLPPPSALVGSGGGVQVYWISTTPLRPERWHSLARRLRAAAEESGLLFDGQCSIDSARILRVPCTNNFKTGTPRPTRILGLGQDYEAALLEERLPRDWDSAHAEAHAGTAGTVAHERDRDTRMGRAPYHAVRGTDAGGETAAHLGTPHPAIMACLGGRIQSLTAGLEPDYPPLDSVAIFRGCGFLRDTLVSRGRGQPEPLWNLALLCAAHLPDGEKFAHAFSSGYEGYNREETAGKFARKLRERDERGIGWPGCDSIHASGSKFCTACPHFGRGKSPLNLGTGLRGTPTPAGTARLERPSEPGGSGELRVEARRGASELPPGYIHNEEGTICVLTERKADGEDGNAGGPKEWVTIPLFQCRISNVWIQDSPEALNFTTTKSLGVTGHVTLVAKQLASPHALHEALFDQGAFLHADGAPYVWRFVVSWMGMLREQKKALQTKPFGWLEDGEGRKGFMYGGIQFTPSGDAPCGWPEESLRQTYTPTGSAEVWREVARLITDQKRPDLDCIIASSFAAPLVGIIGQYSCVISVCGPTGRSKSAAVSVANAVWGNPQMAKETTSSSEKQFIKKMGDLHSLPIYWDDITKERQKFVYGAFRQATEGKERATLTSERKYAKVGTWHSLMLMTSNHSFVDHVTIRDTDTDAGLVRVLEYTVPEKGPGDVGLIKTTDADQQFHRLNYNYGMVGLEYAKMLGSKPREVEEFVRARVDEIADLVKPTQDERFWPVACGVLLAGGHFAKFFGAEIDVDALKAFLLHVYRSNRARHRKEHLAGGTRGHTQDLLAAYLQEFRVNGMWSDVYGAPKGQPRRFVNVFHIPENGRVVRLHFATVERKLRVSRSHFRAWLADERKGGMSAFLVSSLEKDYGVTYPQGALGGGTSHSHTVETLMEFPIAEGSVLEPLLDSHGRVTAAAPPAVGPLPLTGGATGAGAAS